MEIRSTAGNSPLFDRISYGLGQRYQKSGTSCRRLYSSKFNTELPTTVMMCLSKSQNDDIMMMCLSKSQDGDIMMMCLSKSQDGDIIMMCLSKSQDDDIMTMCL